MWVFRKHLIKRGTYQKISQIYESKLEDGLLPSKSFIDDWIRQNGLSGNVEANFSIEIDNDMAEAATIEESMDAYYDELKPGAPVQCIGKRTRKNVKCPICMRRKKTKIKLRCGHIFHRKCIDTWARWKPVCPTCKMALDLKPIPPPKTPPNTPPPTVQPDTEDNFGSVLAI